MPKAYWISNYQSIHNPDALAEYATIAGPALKAAGAATIETWAPGGILLGKFIAAFISFIVIAFVLFLIVKGMNAASKKKEEAAPAPSGPTQEELLTEIRDLLKK